MRDLDYLHLPCLVIGIDHLPLFQRRNITRRACHGKPISDNNLQARRYMMMSSQPSLGSPALIAQIPSCYPAIHHLYLWDVPVLVSHPRPFFSGLIFLVAITRTYPNMTESWKYGTPPQEGQLARVISGIWKNRFPATQRSRTHLKNFKAQHRLHAMIISSMVLHSLYVTIDHTEEWEAHHYHDRFVDDDQ